MMPFYVRVSGARGQLFGFGEPKVEAKELK
jgi:hypothetical protein